MSTLTWLPPTITWLAGLGVTGWAWRRMAPVTRRLGTPTIVDLQRARSAFRVEQLKAAWAASPSDDRTPAARESLALDVPLIIGYVLLLGGLAWWTLDPAIRTFGGWGGALAGLALLAALVAGACDLREDQLCRTLLDEPATDARAAAATRASTVKFALLILAAALLLFVLVPIAVVAA